MPGGSLAKAALVGANTVNGPDRSGVDQAGCLHGGDQRGVIFELTAFSRWSSGVHRRAADHRVLGERRRSDEAEAESET